MAVFALGKWGAEELNLSSDIDVIFVSHDSPTAEQLKKTREFIRLLSESTAWGFAYRVDTDLKPGGRLSPLISSEKQFEDYYWSFGATWERLALVRLRFIDGDQALADRISEMAARYSFRKFLDYSLLEDLRHLRSKIHQHYAEPDPDARNVKLAPGGIRDIELFIHALQIIHGGRQPELRTHSTTVAAQRLKAAQRFKEADLDFLVKTYWQFRQIENTIQAQNDQQTHTLSRPQANEDFDFFFENSRRVEDIVEQVLGRPSAHQQIPQEQGPLQDWLKNAGFSSRAIETLWPELTKVAAESSRTFQDDELRGRVLRLFIESIQENAIDKDLALALLTDFFKSIRVKSSFFSLLAHEERLIKELALLFGCSPYLGGVIANRPELLDSLLFRTTNIESDSLDVYLELLTERRLISETIAANQYLLNRDLRFLSENLSTTADEICLGLMKKLAREALCSPLQILALGKWGGRELGFRSDLDFIFLSDNEPSEAEQRLARRFVSRLTEKHRGGAIYPIDLRLRPSGKAGPMLVTRAALIDYLNVRAEPWERQSYLRARHLTDSAFSDYARQACLSRPLTESDLKSLTHIREQLLKDTGETIDIKYSPGGLIDIEFFSQIYFLNHQILPSTANSSQLLQQISSRPLPETKGVSRLASIMRELRGLEQFLQLFEEHASSAFDPRSNGALRVAQLFKQEPEELFAHLKNLLRESDEILKNIDPRRVRK